MLFAIALFVIASLPVVAVSALLVVMRRWRHLLAFGCVCASIFGLLFLVVVLLVSRGEATPGNTEPPLPLAVGFLYAAAAGVIACDFAAILGIPVLFAGGRRGWRSS